MNDNVQVLGRETLVQNLSKFKAKLVSELVTAVEIVQSKVVSHARLRHGKNAHSIGRYVTRTGNLDASIQPGKVQIMDTEISGEIKAGMSYASFVEGDTKVTASGVELGTSKRPAYPFLAPALFENTPELRVRAQRALKSATGG
jgi:predicted acyltransferase (DUF342 family)